MWPLLIVAAVTCVAFALRRSRWAEASMRASRWTYGLFVPLSLLYFPVKSGFQVRPVECEWTFDWNLAIHSFKKTPHIVMFAVFFLLTWAQLPNKKTAILWSAAACLLMGFLVEIAEGATGVHGCRMRDLIPDMAGAAAGAVVILVARYLTGLWLAGQGRL